MSATINKLEAFVLPLRARSTRAHGIGKISGGFEVVLLRLEDEAGLVGWGEAAPWAVFTGTAEAAFAALDAHLRPYIIGADPADCPDIMKQANGALVGHPEAKAALESALLDLMGKRAGVPVYTLLGGAARRRIPLSVSIADPEWKLDLDLIAYLHSEGVRILKLKAGFADHAFDLMRIEAIRKDYGEDFSLRLDYNQGLPAHDALRRLRDMDGMDLDFIEQPVPAQHWRMMRELAQAIDTPIMADESVFSPEDMLRAAHEGIANAVSIKIMKAGGLRDGLTIARMARAAGWAAYGGDMFETGLAHLAGAHMIAAAPDITLGCEFYHARYHLTRDILAAPFPIEGGYVTPPDAPGLGAEVDEKFVRAAARVKSGEGRG